MTDTTVLRVLNGRLSGTAKPVPASGTVSIGHDFWQDVVIRDAATKGIAVDLTLSDGAAQMMVLSGEAQLLGSRLEAGQTAILPPYVPFSIGGVALAWGNEESDRWGEAGGLALSQPAPPALPPGPSDRAVAVLGQARSQVGSILERPRVVGIGLAVIAAVLALILIPSAVATLGLLGTPTQRAQRELDRAGLGTLKASEDPQHDGVIVAGLVANDAQRAKAQTLMSDADIPAIFQVRTNGELAAATADVARIHGIQALARPLGLRQIELRTVPIPVEKRDQLIAAIRTDVPGIRRLTLRGDLPPEGEAKITSISDATKKVSTVVAGDPSYIQTVDGAHYFAGAMLPSGHRLVRIEGNVVVLEKAGQETRIAF